MKRFIAYVGLLVKAFLSLLVLGALGMLISSCEKEEPCADVNICHQAQYDRMRILDTGYKPGEDYSLSYIHLNVFMLDSCRCHGKFDSLGADEYKNAYLLN